MSRSYPTGGYGYQEPQSHVEKIDSRKERFEELNQHIRAHGGWITSVPGNRFVDFETLPDSPLPDNLRARGYTVEPDGYGERILPHSKVEFFTKDADGTLSLLTEGSTQPVASRFTHAGIAAVDRFFFLID
jgi:hypothetical protein